MITLPTFAELRDGILADLNTEYGITIPLIGKNFLRAMASVQAGKLWLLYKAIGNTQKNIFIDTADPEAIGGTLERFGRVKLGRNPNPATSGEYTLQLTGTIGATVPASSTFKSNDDSLSPGFLFVLDNAFVLDGIDIITVRALEPGPNSRLAVGNGLTLTAPVAFVDSSAIVLTESVIPIAAENLEDYRRKALDAYRLEPQGGAGSDYRIWASEAVGVLQSYPFAVSGSNNEVNLFVEATIIDSVDSKGTPTAAILSAAESAIEDPTLTRPSRKPLAVFKVNYLAISPKDVDIEITGFVGLTAAIQASILTAITDELSSVRPFVSSIDILSLKNDIYDVNRIISSILIANPGSVFGAVVLKVAGSPVVTFTFASGDIPFLNSITYV